MPRIYFENFSIVTLLQHYRSFQSWSINFLMADGLASRRVWIRIAPNSNNFCLIPSWFHLINFEWTGRELIPGPSDYEADPQPLGHSAGFTENTADVHLKIKRNIINFWTQKYKKIKFKQNIKTYILTLIFFSIPLSSRLLITL